MATAHQESDRAVLRGGFSATREPEGDFTIRYPDGSAFPTPGAIMSLAAATRIVDATLGVA